MKTFKNKAITINCFIPHVGCKKPIIVKSAIISATIMEKWKIKMGGSPKMHV